MTFGYCIQTSCYVKVLPPLDHGGPWTDELDQPLPQHIQDLLNQYPADSFDMCNMGLEVEVRGFCVPAQTYGPPEKCYPVDGEETRTVTGATFIGPGIIVDLPSSSSIPLQEHFEKTIAAIDVDYD